MGCVDMIIQAKTGKSPAEFRELAKEKGFTAEGQIAPGVKAGEIVKWLKADFQPIARASQAPCDNEEPSSPVHSE